VVQVQLVDTLREPVVDAVEPVELNRTRRHGVIVPADVPAQQPAVERAADERRDQDIADGQYGAGPRWLRRPEIAAQVAALATAFVHSSSGGQQHQQRKRSHQ
jgi:hypothetical protein